MFKHKKVSSNESDNNMILATIKNEIIGILGIVIKKEYCNLYIDKVMMDYIINWFKSNNITTKISLSEIKDNKIGIALYKKCGFETAWILKNEIYIDSKFFNIVVMGLVL